MSSVNKTVIKTNNAGGRAFSGYISPINQLKRCVLANLLWEDEFYESGEKIADRISKLAMEVTPKQLADLAVEARSSFHLRHVPLLLLAILCRSGSGSSIVSETFPKVIQRADELTEFVAIYAKVNGTTPDKVKKKLSAQAKKGLAKAFIKFDEHQLSKYNRDGAVKLRDVMFLCHPKAKDKEQALMHGRLAVNGLKVADTWETNLSAGADKKETFERLIQEDNLGYFALLRNLRNMVNAGVDIKLIKHELANNTKGVNKILPFRYIAAARACPQLEPELDKAMIKSVDYLPELKGTTVVLVDVSGSMDRQLSSKSDLTRIDAASALASIVKSDHLRIFTFSTTTVEVPPRKGMACIDAIKSSQAHSSTRLKEAIQAVEDIKYDRIIVISDEESQTGITDPRKGSKAYLINVASSKNGLGYGVWNHIDGFSENVIKFINESEQQGE